MKKKFEDAVQSLGDKLKAQAPTDDEKKALEQKVVDAIAYIKEKAAEAKAQIDKDPAGAKKGFMDWLKSLFGGGDKKNDDSADKKPENVAQLLDSTIAQ